MKNYKRTSIISLVVVILMSAVITVPAMAAEDEKSLGASVTVSEFVSITLEDAGDPGIQFGYVNPGNEYGDIAQVAGPPAIPAVGVAVEPETNVNVDISIYGETVSTNLPLANWKYSTSYGGSRISLLDTYTEIYSDVAPDSSSPIFHWVNVPLETSAGTETCTVYYKAATASP